MRISDGSSDVCSSHLLVRVPLRGSASRWAGPGMYRSTQFSPDGAYLLAETLQRPFSHSAPLDRFPARHDLLDRDGKSVMTVARVPRSDNLPRGRMAVQQGDRKKHTSELQSLMRISYAVFCLKKKTRTQRKKNKNN